MLAGKPDAPASLAELEALASGLRILVADDAAANRILIQRYLKRTQSTIDIAEDGAMAVEMFKSGHYDLVLMDIEMPVMDGYRATREIRRLESATGAAPVPVLALTAHTFEEMAARAAIAEFTQAGFTGVLTKPIRDVTLLEAVVRYRSTDMRPATQPVGARAEPAMEDLARAYIGKRRSEVPVYMQALEREDFGAIRRLAHNMKGSGSGYGFPALTELGGAIEKAALRAAGSEVRLIVNRFVLYLESVELKQV